MVSGLQQSIIRSTFWAFLKYTAVHLVKSEVRNTSWFSERESEPRARRMYGVGPKMTARIPHLVFNLTGRGLFSPGDRLGCHGDRRRGRVCVLLWRGRGRAGGLLLFLKISFWEVIHHVYLCLSVGPSLCLRERKDTFIPLTLFDAQVLSSQDDTGEKSFPQELNTNAFNALIKTQKKHVPKISIMR